MNRIAVDEDCVSVGHIISQETTSCRKGICRDGCRALRIHNLMVIPGLRRCDITKDGESHRQAEREQFIFFHQEISSLG